MGVAPPRAPATTLQIRKKNEAGVWGRQPPGVFKGRSPLGPARQTLCIRIIFKGA